MEKKFDDQIRFLDRHRDEIKPVVNADEAQLLDRLYDGILTQEQIDRILHEQETKVFVLDKPQASPEALKALLVGRDPGAALGIKSLIAAMEKDDRVGSLGLIIDGVAQSYLKEDLKPFEKLDGSPLVIADIMKSAEKPYDVIINTGSTINNPASVTLKNKEALTGGKSSAKTYFVYEAYEWGVTQDYYDEVEGMDGIFCNDEVAKAILMERFPDFDPDHIYVTGTGQIDSVKADQAENLYRSGREKLEIDDTTFTVAYLGTISSAYRMYGLDDRFDEKSWMRTVDAMARLAERYPGQKFALLYRYHPRDPQRDEKFTMTESMKLPQNLMLKKATNEQGLSADEVLYASNAISSVTLTENFKSKHRARQGIYLGFEDPGMGADYLKKIYSPEIIAAMEEKGGVAIVKNDDALFRYLESIKDKPIEQPKVKPGETSAERILDVLSRDQSKEQDRTQS